MLTLFALPKAFEGHINIIQRNAIESWTRLEPRPRIVLFGDEDGTAQAAQEFGLDHVPEIARNEYGTPLVSDIFLQAQARAGGGVLCYVNADIMLMSDFSRAVAQVSRRRSRFLMGGRRWTVDLPHLWDFGGDWEARLRALVDEHGTLDPPHSIDYFVFPAGFWTQIPPFAIGRFFWDNWLLYQCRARKAPLIQATPAITVVHQSHGYNHAGTTADTLHQGPEARRNLELAGGGHHLYSLSLASHILTPQGLRRRPPGRWQIERWQHEWNHRSRRALEGLQRVANGPSRWRPLARAALWGFDVSGAPRRRLGRAITRWRENV